MTVVSDPSQNARDGREGRAAYRAVQIGDDEDFCRRLRRAIEEANRV